MKEATHLISAVYFPGRNEVDLTWEDIETGERAALTVTVTPQEGKKISQVVWPCVYHPSVTVRRVEC